MKHDITEELEIAKGVTITFHNGVFSVKGAKGEIKRELFNPKISCKVENGTITFHSENATKREKKLINSYVAHLENMMRGVNEGHSYKLKVCAGHFPMTASMKGNVFEIKNFIGEAVPRTVTIPAGVTVKVDGAIVSVDSIDKELAGMVAAKLEQLTRRPGFDRRIFQDGVYITEKDGKPLKI